MADLRLDDGNFCIGTYPGTFCSMDDVNHRLVTKNTSNGFVGTQYSLVPELSYPILSLEYVGPKDLSATEFGGPLPFFSLDASYIRKWELNDPISLDSVSSGTNNGNYTTMAVEHYTTSFSVATATGTGKIKLTDDTYVDVGTELLLGPSDDAGDDGAYEYVEVTSISGGWVYITSDGATPPHYQYDNGNDITFAKYIYVFSNDGYLRKLNLDYSIVETKYSDIYSGVSAAAWSDNYKAIGFVKDEGCNLLYVDPYQNYQLLKSHTLNTVKSDKVNPWIVYDLAFEGSSIYRLQHGQTLVDDDGEYSDTDWGSSYSYHQDTSDPYTKNISICADPAGIVVNYDVIILTTVVRDQYGVGLLGKTVTFSDDDTYGEFDPIGGTAVTNASGIAEIDYDLNKPGGDAPSFPSSHDITIKVKTDGASASTGSSWVWDGMKLLCHRKFTIAADDFIEQKQTLIGTWPVEGDDLYTQMYMTQISGMENDFYLKAKSKFQFPGGNWIGTNPPSDLTTSVSQLEQFESDMNFDQIDNEIDSEVYLDQDKEQSNDLQVSQTYVSRHVLTGHYDSADIDQFQFIEDAIPAFWSEKNPVSTNIWIRLRPFAYSLNQSTLIFRVREISYAGDTHWQDVTSSCVVSTFDAGGGLLGLDILYNPPSDFHHNGIVYVDIVVYDTAPTPNIIVTDYWFKIIPDYRAPYIENEDPSRGEENVVRNTNISFDVKDAGVGVDINTLEFYVNNRKKIPVISNISGGYHVEYNPPDDFFYGQTVEITVKIKDASDYENALHDMWRFYIEESTGPWIDLDSFYPRNCTRGIPRKLSEVSFNVYGINDTGVDRDSIVVHIGGKERDVTIIPIVYRVS
jgi:hypothetical protein